MKSNKEKAKVINLIMNILMYVFLALSIMLLILCIFSKKDSDGSISILGYQTRIVISESMEKCESTYDQICKYRIKSIPIKSVVLVKTVPSNESSKERFYEKIKVGDVLTFKYVIGTRQETITHRVIDIRNTDEGKVVELRGDNIQSNHNTNTTSQIININDINSHNYIIGKVVAKSYVLGVLLFALKKPLGMVLLIIIPSIILMVVEIIKIANYIYSLKKAKTENELMLQKEELEKLKIKLQALEQSEEGGKCV